MSLDYILNTLILLYVLWYEGRVASVESQLV